MARAIWNGSVSFGLVNIPVKLYPATSPRDVRFHQFDRASGKRVRYRRVVPFDRSFHPPEVSPGTPGTVHEERNETPTSLPSEAARSETSPESAPRIAGSSSRETEVAFEDIVKGVEVADDLYVTVSPDELRSLEPGRSHVIEIEEFIDLAEIDPIHYEKSYYVAPVRGSGAEKPYALLLRAMEKAGRVGIARFVLRTKEHLAAVRPKEGVLVLETMFYADEIQDVAEIAVTDPGVALSGREISMAEQLIKLLETSWDPSRYRDTYRERVLELIQSKVEGQETIRAEEAEPSVRVPDLMAALRASVEAAKEAKAEARPKRKRRTG